MAIFQYPFAEDGDRNTDLPNAASLTGLVSFQEGFTPIYETLPSLGGQYIQRRDFNEIVHRICAGVNTLEAQIPSMIPPSGYQIVADMATAVGVVDLGVVYYCIANDNIFLLIDTTSVTEESTLGDLATAGKVKNITPLGLGQTWQDMKSQRKKGVVYTNTTGRPIIINVGIYPAAGGGGQHIYHGYDNALADDYAFNGGSAAPSYGGSKTVTILPNEQYKYVADSGTIYTWLELR